MSNPTANIVFSGTSMLKLLLAAIIGIAAALFFALSPAAAGPTCSELGMANHGHHIVGDYVTGEGVLTVEVSDFEWPPAGNVGQHITGSGAVGPGAPGVHQHAGGHAQPGASFCNPQAQSPTGNDFPGKGKH